LRYSGIDICLLPPPFYFTHLRTWLTLTIVVRTSELETKKPFGLGNLLNALTARMKMKETGKRVNSIYLRRDLIILRGFDSFLWTINWLTDKIGYF
jgi:hypothetical protein